MQLPKLKLSMLAIFALLVIPVLVHAASLSDVLSAGAIGVAIGFLIAALGYMVAGIIGTPQAQGWAKNELFENFYTLFLVANIGVLALASLIFFAAFPASSAVAPSFGLDLDSITKAQIITDAAIKQVDVALEGAPFSANQTGQPYVSTSTWGVKQVFLASYIIETLIGEWSYLGQISFHTLGAGGTVSKGGAGIGAVDAISLKAPLFPGLSKITDILEDMNELMILVMFMLLAHKGLLIFIALVGPQILLIGIFFRCIPFTRRLGSTMMALFITLQFVYPAFILISFSDDFNGKIMREFSGVYVSTDWMTALPDADGTQIIFLSPTDIVQVGNNTKEINFTFSARTAIYNYSVMDDNGNQICKGIGVATEPISCPIKLDSLKPLDVVADADKLDNAVYFYNITIDFYGSSVDLSQSEYIKPDYPYKESLSVPILVVKECTTPVCDQKYIVKNAEFNQVRDAYISNQKNPEQFAENLAQQTANMLVLAQKFALHYYSESAMKEVSKTLVKQVVKEGTKKATKSILSKAIGGVAGGVGAIVTFTLSSALIKADVATGMFDEIACDAYSGYMAQSYIDPPSNAPEVNTAQLDFWKKVWLRAGQAKDFIAEVGLDMARSYGSMYDASDYKSCAASTGAFNYLAGKLTGYSPREFNVTVLMTRVVMVFMISLFSVIISVTFFRSISESIGGDSSLMGLGKLL